MHSGRSVNILAEMKASNVCMYVKSVKVQGVKTKTQIKPIIDVDHS